MKNFVRLTLFVIATSVCAAPAAAQEYPPGCETCERTFYYYVTPYITNGARGDQLLHSPTSSMLGQIMRAMGMNYTHVGVLMDYGYNFRHNFSNIENTIGQHLEKHTGMGDWGMFGSVDYGDIYIEPYWLYNGHGFMQWGTVGNYWDRSTTVMVKDGNSYTADTMTNLSHRYTLSSFTNLPLELSQNGAMCSGSTAVALSQSGSRQINSRSIHVPYQVVAGIGAKLYDKAYDVVLHDPDNGKLDNQGRDNIAKTIKHQVTSCLMMGVIGYTGYCGPMGGKGDENRTQWYEQANYQNNGYWINSIPPDDIAAGMATHTPEWAGGYWQSYQSIDEYCWRQYQCDGPTGDPTYCYNFDWYQISCSDPSAQYCYDSSWNQVNCNNHAFY